MNCGGIIYGLLRGFICIYVILAIISFVAPAINISTVNAIDKSFLGGPLYRNNIILNMIK